VLGRAFQDDPMVAAILRGMPAKGRVPRLTTAFAATLSSAVGRSAPRCVFAQDRVAGVALVHPPGTFPPPLGAQIRIVLSTVARHGLYGLGRWAVWLRVIGRHHPKTAHYYLEHLGVDPRFQGRGIGSLLLAGLAQEADRGAVDCFLETANPRNLRLYERFGFERVSECDINGVRTWFMLRRPRPY
jgi:GNAT superfamily N-acetyltransferase